MALTKLQSQSIDTNITVAGIVTASAFYGDGSNLVGVATASSATYAETSGISTVSQGLSGTPNITVGVITAVSASFSGNVSIAGTLTYEDVTNVDSIGLVTARSGVQVTGGNLLVGSTSDTGTLSQPLQVTGGAYVSGNLGIGITNPISKLHVSGDVNITGVVTATTFNGNLALGNVTGLGANVATFLATPSSANLAAAVTDETGSGALVFATSPSLTTPNIGAATATSINKVTITTPATSSTLTIANSKTLTVSNTLTFTGTDSSSVAFGGGGTVAYTANKLNVFAATTSSELAGVISDETGSGSLVFANTPTLVTPNIGAATGTSLSVTGQLSSTVATGTAPLTVSSTTVVTNLNADLLDGQQGSYYLNYNNFTNTPTIPTVNNGTLTLAVSGTGLSGSASFTANQSGNTTFTVTSNATSANTGSTIVARDASGNFSAGTVSGTLSGQVNITAGNDITGNYGNWTGEKAGKIQFHGNNLYLQYTSNLIGRNSSGTDRLTLDSSGNLGIGFTNPSAVSGAGQGTGIKAEISGSLYLYEGSNASNNGGGIGFGIASFPSYTPMAQIKGLLVNAPAGGTELQGDLAFYTRLSGSAGQTLTERARITNAGYFKATNNGSYVGSTSSYHEFSQSANSVNTVIRGNNTGYTAIVTQIDCSRSANSAYTFLMAYSNVTTAADVEFNLRGDGQAYADGSWNGGGADYAEYFEWEDGNPNNEDRRGYTVSLVGDKIKIAEEGEVIIGAISGNPSVVGDAAWNKWTGKYLTDNYGSYIFEEHNVVEWTDEDGKEHSYEDWNLPEDVVVPEDATIKTHDDKGNRFTHRKLNPEYDSDQEYIPREERPEWDAVGMMGKLRIRKGQVVDSRWIKMKDISDTVEEWLVR